MLLPCLPELVHEAIRRLYPRSVERVVPQPLRRQRCGGHAAAQRRHLLPVHLPPPHLEWRAKTEVRGRESESVFISPL